MATVWKNIQAVLSAAVLATILAGCGPAAPPTNGSPAAPAAAQPQLSSPAGGLHPGGLVRCAGWAVGYVIHGNAPSTSVPVILATADGGRTWTVQDAGGDLADAQLDEVCFVNARDGWVLGTNENTDCSVILATTDGGKTWRQQYSDPYGITGDALTAITFVNARNGWVAGDNENTGSPLILATTDGGNSWSAQHVPGTGTWNQASVFFVNPRDGWAVGGGILATTDGGKTWTVQNAPGGISIAGLPGISFANARDGWIVGARASGPYQNGMRFTPLVLATTDGGKTWTVQPLPRAVDSYNLLQGVDFINRNDGWAVAAGILATTDGGKKWTVQNTPSKTLLRSVSFINPKDGWAVGDVGTVMVTTDGGTTWNQVQNLPQAASAAFLKSVSFPRVP